MQWYYADQGQQKGPVEEAALDELVLAGAVRDDTLVWREGMQNWQPHASVRGPRTRPAVPEPVVGDVKFCGQCGRPFPPNDLVEIGTVSLCAMCKPAYVQRLREGALQGIGTRRYGGFWIRFVARVIDGLLVQVVLVALAALLTASFRAGAPRSGTIALAIIYPLSFGLSAGYEIYFLTSRGATLGKMLFGLKVIRSDGSKLSAGVSTSRYFAQFLSYITLGIGYLMAGFDEEKRALHDRICETRVVYSK
jgi:uncharacterized RDD family membrane protein YckC